MEKNKELSVKDYFLYALLGLFGFGIWYFSTAFVLMELNPENWNSAARFLVVAEGLVTAFGIITVAHTERNK